MTNTYTALATITLTSTDTSIDFANIPNTYRDLVLVCSARSTRAAATDFLLFKLNNDTTTSYSRVFMLGSGSGSGTSYADTISVGTIDVMPAASASSGIYGVGRLQAMDYSATDKHKTMLIRTDIATNATFAQATRWAKTEAINSISLYMENGSIASGSTFSLYGIRS